MITFRRHTVTHLGKGCPIRRLPTHYMCGAPAARLPAKGKVCTRGLAKI